MGVGREDVLVVGGRVRNDGRILFFIFSLTSISTGGGAWARCVCAGCACGARGKRERG